MLYCEIDITEFVPAVDMLAVHTAEKDYQIVQSLRFPFNALYEWIERGYIVPMGFPAERGYSSHQYQEPRCVGGVQCNTSHELVTTLSTGHMADNLGFGDDIPTSLLLAYMQHEFRSTPSFPRHKQLLAILKKNISILVQHDRVRDHLGLPPKRERSINIGTSLVSARVWWNEAIKRPRFDV